MADHAREILLALLFDAENFDHNSHVLTDDFSKWYLDE